MAVVSLAIKDNCFYDHSAKGQPDQTATHPLPTPQRLNVAHYIESVNEPLNMKTIEW